MKSQGIWELYHTTDYSSTQSLVSLIPSICVLEWGAYFLALCLERITHLRARGRKASLLMRWGAKRSQKDNVRAECILLKCFEDYGILSVAIRMFLFPKWDTQTSSCSQVKCQRQWKCVIHYSLFHWFLVPGSENLFSLRGFDFTSTGKY